MFRFGIWQALAQQRALHSAMALGLVIFCVSSLSVVAVVVVAVDLFGFV